MTTATIAMYGSADLECECSDGILYDQTYNESNAPPDGAVFIQRCDLCCRHEGDMEAAMSLFANGWTVGTALALLDVDEPADVGRWESWVQRPADA